MKPRRPKNSKDLLLIDGMNLVFKAAFSTGGLKSGEIPTGVVYGFLNMIKAMVGTFWPRGIIVCWEGRHGKDKRKKLYPGYKDRPKLDLDMASVYQQIDIVNEFIYHLGIGTLTVDEYEADDSIAAVSRIATDAEISTVIVSNDEDLWQLINEYVCCYNISKTQILGQLNFESIVGVSLRRYLDYKCLVGDNSDKIKGIAGIGPDTAKKICALKYGLKDYMKKGEASIARTKNLFVDEPDPYQILNRNNQLMNLRYGRVGGRMDPVDMNVIPQINIGSLDKDEVCDLLEDYDMWSFRDDFPQFIMGFNTMCLQEVIDGI